MTQSRSRLLAMETAKGRVPMHVYPAHGATVWVHAPKGTLRRGTWDEQSRTFSVEGERPIREAEVLEWNDTHFAIERDEPDVDGSPAV